MAHSIICHYKVPPSQYEDHKHKKRKQQFVPFSISVLEMLAQRDLFNHKEIDLKNLITPTVPMFELIRCNDANLSKKISNKKQAE